MPIINRHSFSARLSWIVVLMTSVLFIICATILDISSEKLLKKEAISSARNLLDLTIKKIEKAQQSVEAAVNASSWLVKEKLNEPEYLSHITSRIVRENPFIVGSTIAFPGDSYGGIHLFSPYSYKDGKVIKVKQLGEEYDYMGSEWFKVPYEAKTSHWSEPYFDDGGGNMYMTTFSFPIKDNHGSVIAVMTADVLIDSFTEYVSQIKPYEDSYAGLVTRKGVVINETTVQKTVYLQEIAAEQSDPRVQEAMERALKGEKGQTFYYDRSFHKYLTLYGPLEDTMTESSRWSLLIVIPYIKILEPTARMHLAVLLVIILGLVALFIVCYFGLRRFTKPLSDLCMASHDIAGGNFHTELPKITSEDEIRELRDSFDGMQNSLLNYTEELKHTVALNERYESELNIASAIQTGILPSRFPNDDNLEVYSLLDPAREVGGDLFDFNLTGSNLLFTVGDVSGKGVPGAIIMALSTMALRFIADLNIPLSRKLMQINNTVSKNNSTQMFVTMFVGTISMDTMTMTYCNAGHNRIVVIPPSSPAYFLQAKANLALGIMDNFPYQEETMHLEHGTRLLLYTDGVTEAERGDKAQFGDDRLLEWADTNARNASARTVCESLMAAVRDFVQGNEQNDDITIMTINIK